MFNSRAQEEIFLRLYNKNIDSSRIILEITFEQYFGEPCSSGGLGRGRIGFFFI